SPPTPPTPPPVGNYPPDLFPSGITINATDETQVATLCVQVTDIASPPPKGDPARITYQETPAGPFTTRLDLYEWNGENWTLAEEPEQRHTTQMSNTVGQQATMCFPLQLEAGLYLVNTFVDSNNEVAESNETNNV